MIRKSDKALYLFLIAAAALYVYQLAESQSCKDYAQLNHKQYHYSRFSCLIKHEDGTWFSRKTYERMRALRVLR